MRKNCRTAPLFLLLLLFLGAVAEHNNTPRRSSSSSVHHSTRERRASLRNSGGFCVHRVPSADTRYVPVLNPGIPVVTDGSGDHPHRIDVMVVYTAAARALRGGTSAAVLADAESMVSKTNAIYQESGIPARLNLVYTTEASGNYVEGADILEDLNAITGGTDGHMDDVHSLRRCVGADLVMLLTSPQAHAGQTDASTVIGAAWLRTNSPAFDGTAFAPFAFAVLRYNLFSGGGAVINLTAQTFAHEIGHVAGCLHDIDTHTPSELSLLREARALGYSFVGAQDGRQYRTIMSARRGAERIDLHASPRVLFQGTAAGDAQTGDCSAFLSAEMGFLEAFVAGSDAASCPPELVGCDGKVLSGVLKDRCGVCGGLDACVDCEGTVDGGKELDCANVCGGGAVIDCENVCNGAAVVDCGGTCNGGRVEDCAGRCGGPALEDCSGMCNGNAFVDDCGVCASGTTGKIPNAGKDCRGVCGGDAQIDECGECGGDGSSCMPGCRCPLPPNYWGAHNCFAPVPSRVEAWPAPYVDCSERVKCGGETGILRWVDVVHSPTDRANAWLTLAKHWIAARLNMAGSPCMAEVGTDDKRRLIDAMDSGELLLERTATTCASGSVPSLSGNSADGLTALALATTIARFNERIAFSDGECLRMAMPAVEDERCEGGCTRTLAYWSIHHARSLSPSLRKPWPGGGEDAEICPGERKLDVMVVAAAPVDAWVALARQTVVTELNILSDACVPEEVASALLFARSLLATLCIDSSSGGGHEAVGDQRDDMMGLASILAAYGRGELGPGECGTLPQACDPWSAGAPPCEGGCVHTMGYWSTHHANATTRAALRLPWPLAGPDGTTPAETTRLCGTDWLDVMLSSTDGVWNVLAREWISARLNVLSGACTTRSVENAVLLGAQILEGECGSGDLPEGARDAALEIIRVLGDYSSGCGGRGPSKCAGEDNEMQVVVIDGMEATAELEQHQEQCEEAQRAKCQSEKDRADSFVIWAVIVTVLLVIITAILLVLVLWWWWKMRRAERRRTRRKRPEAGTTPKSASAFGRKKDGGGGAGFNSGHTVRRNAQLSSSPWT